MEAVNAAKRALVQFSRSQGTLTSSGGNVLQSLEDKEKLNWKDWDWGAHYLTEATARAGFVRKTRPHARCSENMAPNSLTWTWEGVSAWREGCSVNLGRDHSILFPGTFAFGALSWLVRNPAIPGPSHHGEAPVGHMERPWVGFLFGSLSWAQLLCPPGLSIRCVWAKKALQDSKLKWVTSCLWERPTSRSTHKPPHRAFSELLPHSIRELPIVVALHHYVLGW